MPCLRSWAAAIALLCALSTPLAFGQSQDTGGKDLKTPPPPGKLIDIGGYRLHALIQGHGGPSVVLLAGAGDFSIDWALVQPAVARFTTVCAYDRAGFAWSDLGPLPRTMKQEAYELHLLLQHAHLPPPYVLVGHSFGGMLCRVYASACRSEVAGMVLVDSADENQFSLMGKMVNGHIEARLVRRREEAVGKPVPPVQTLQTSPLKPFPPEIRRQMEESLKMIMPAGVEPPYDRLPARLQQVDLWFRQHPKLAFPDEEYSAEELQLLYLETQKTPHPLGDIPLISLRAGTHATPDVAQLKQVNMTLDDWSRYQEEVAAHLAGVSSNSRWYVAKDSSHHVQLDDPELVVFAIRRVVEAARHHQRL
jgi:pimeloyl-ACP methyl ester carboxylesterase